MRDDAVVLDVCLTGVATAVCGDVVMVDFVAVVGGISAAAMARWIFS